MTSLLNLLGLPKLTRKEMKVEFVAGLTTFLTMAYIVFVNPSILSTPQTGMVYGGVLTATVLLSFLMTLFMGLYAKLPFAVAPGMGINAFFTFTLILGNHIEWQLALGMVFWSGILFLIISVTGIREGILRAIPTNLRVAISVGIGLFLTFIGLKNMGFIQAHPATLVTLGKITPRIVISLMAMAIMFYFLKKKNPLAFLIGMVVATVVSLAFGFVSLPPSWFSAPDFESVAMRMNVWGALKLSLLPSIISLMFTDLFDSISTFMGVSRACGLVDKNGEPKNMKQGLLVDAFATLIGGPLGTSSGTAYIESAAGIEVGGRTGWTSVFTALFFLPCLFLAPIAKIIPTEATSPVLVIVGFMMFRSVKEIETEKWEEALPAFLSLILIPLTFSITQGILWGFLSHVCLFTLVGRARDVSRPMWAVSFVCLILLIIENGSR